jgi:hypothetical protein
MAHYGLPAEKPRDRHKWFFGFSEAIEFLEAQQARYSLRIVERVANEKPRPLLVRALRRLCYPVELRYLNRYAHTVWAVFEKSA